jgi:hypothetical protein
MRTRGMAEELRDGSQQQTVHGLGALAVRLLAQRVKVELVELPAGDHATETAASPPSELTSATPGWRSW